MLRLMRNPFEQPHVETPSDPELATPEPTAEQRAETRDQVIEHASEGRRNILKDIFTSRTADLIGNFIPGVDVPKMIGEAIAGKTVSGEGLSNRKRFDHVAIAGGIALAYGLGFAGIVHRQIVPLHRRFARRLSPECRPASNSIPVHWAIFLAESHFIG